MTTTSVKYAALCLTHDCNLRCCYCYAGAKINRSMTSETARRSIDFLCEHADGKCIVTFFGGEPLLEFDLMKDIIAYCGTTYRERIEFRLNTNATLINADKLAYFKDIGLYFAMSVDGNREQHDTIRCFVDERGSYDRIASKFGEILAFNPYTIAVSVIVPETVEHLASGAQDLFHHGFRYVLQTLDYSAGWTTKDIAALKRQYLEFSDFYFQQLAAGKKIYFSPFDERIKTWAQKPYGPGDLCDLANSQIAIAPSGRIYPCVQFVNSDDGAFQENSIGSVYDGFDETKREYFIAENYRDKESCRGCPLYGRCATYCGCINWRATGSLSQVPPIVCEHERMLMPIVDRLANRLWKKDVTLFKRKFYEKTFPVSSYIEDCLINRRQAHAAD